VRLSLVIVNFHSLDYVRSCVASVDPSWCSQVVLVDNSVDRSEAQQLIALEVRVPYEVIVEPSNLGFGGAANDGINLAFGRDPDSAVWLVNPDMSFSSETPKALIDRLKLDVDDVLSPTIVTGQQNDLRIWFAGGSADGTTGNVIHDDYLSPYTLDGVATRQTTFMCGAAPVFTRRAWEMLRGFRSDLFLYWEDVELSLRAQDAGLRMTVLGSAAPVWHAVGGTGEGSGQSEAFYYYSARNRVLVLGERGWRGNKLITLMQMAKFAARALRREKEHRLRKFLQALRGYMAGFSKTEAKKI
jgi:N-acetylglucosaminyl-diphospho-decaprenol L-rhamnosyltransferase